MTAGARDKQLQVRSARGLPAERETARRAEREKVRQRVPGYRGGGGCGVGCTVTSGGGFGM